MSQYRICGILFSDIQVFEAAYQQIISDFKLISRGYQLSKNPSSSSASAPDEEELESDDEDDNIDLEELNLRNRGRKLANYIFQRGSMFSMNQ